MAKATFGAAAEWSGRGVYTEAAARGFKVAMDEPAELGGTNRAMNPVEMLLCSLGGCMCICAAAFAQACRVELRGFRVELEGDLDLDGFMGKNPEARKGYQQIRYRLHLDTPSPAENVERLVSLIKERCPVSDTLAGVEVVGSVVGER